MTSHTVTNVDDVEVLESRVHAPRTAGDGHSDDA